MSDLALRGIYLASYRAYHPNHDIVYQDINGKRDLGGDMMDIDLVYYDYIIATPPCNWWSRANYRRNRSKYALTTKHLLIDILNVLAYQDKPFLVENVCSSRLFMEHGLFNLPCFVYVIGRHTYWSNVLFSQDVLQVADDIHHKSSSARQGGRNVHDVVERFLYTIGA